MTLMETVEDERIGVDRPISVAVLNDYEIVVRGLRSMLEPFAPHIAVVEVEAGDNLSSPVDVALFDTFAGRRNTVLRASDMVHSGLATYVVLYTWDATPEMLEAARRFGVAGVVLKSRSADAIVDALDRIVIGELVGFNGPARDTRPFELSDRESEVLALIAKGATNGVIAHELYLSVETIKTYVKRLYAKLGVHNRAQAAVTASEHGLAPRLTSQF